MLTSLAVVLIAPAPAQAGTYKPPPGRVFTGVSGGLRASDYARFASAVAHRPAVWQVFLTWDQDRGANPYLYLRARLADARRLGARPMVHLSTARQSGREYLSPQAVAMGRGDPYLLRVGSELAGAGRPVYVRPYAEMNQANNVYSAIGRGRSHSTKWFRRMFRRTVLILRGGPAAAINRRLAANRMPRLRTSAGELPAGRVAVVWCPQVSSDAWAYWPGAAYVDWVGTDFYSGFPNWSGLASFYRRTARYRKPFALAELGIWQSGDRPGFISALMRWARSHRRVRMVMYFQGNDPGGQFDIRRWPATRSALRAAWRHPRFL